MSKLDDGIDGKFALRRVPGRFYVSRRFRERGPDGTELVGPDCRFAYEVFDGNEDVAFASDSGWDVVLRETPTRQQLKALFFESPHQVRMLAFQRFDAEGRPVRRESFVLRADEVEQLAGFLALVRSSALDLAEHEDGVRVLPAGIDALLSDGASRHEIFHRYRDVFVDLFEGDVDSPEVVAYARRRSELTEFERYLVHAEAFDARRAVLRAAGRASGPEAVWQNFFETNRWIFGTGLATQFMHAWDPRKLEQATVGSSVFGAGKRPDALMRSAGALSALAFVEIKSHDTPLLVPRPYRSGVWRVSDDVAGGVAQCQTTVDETLRNAERQLELRDGQGFPSGDRALVCRPRSILVVGSLNEFIRDGQLSLGMFESFERFRRSLRDPEIVTFDELYERARMSMDFRQTSNDDVEPASSSARSDDASSER